MSTIFLGKIGSLELPRYVPISHLLTYLFSYIQETTDGREPLRMRIAEGRNEWVSYSCSSL